MEQLVAVEQVNGHYVAESLTFPELRAEAVTQDLAVAGVTMKIRERLRSRTIVRVDVLSSNPMVCAGMFTGAAAEAMQEICDEAYRLRNADRDQQDEAVSSVGASPEGLSSLFGKYRDDETLTEICDEAYRQRDADTLPGASHDSL